jgi:TatD DNase family protein
VTEPVSPPVPPPVPPPEPLPAEALDSHCHLDLIERPVPEVLADARAAGITRVVTIGVDLPTSRWAAECADSYANVYAAVAIHPNETAQAAGSAAARDAVLAELAALAELQREWFRAHIDIAKQTGKALVIHDREAHEDVLRILDTDGPPERVIFHCFSGDAAMAKRCAEAGYLMSFAGNVTFSSARQLREAAAAAPLELILVETDAPFLTPVPYRGKPNSPAMVAHTLRAIAEVKQVGVADLCAAVTAAGERAFGPWPN